MAAQAQRPPPAELQLHEVLFSQGFGTRRVCAGLVQQGRVAVFDPARPEGPPAAVTDPAQPVALADLRFRCGGHDWPYQARAYLMLHKPAGFECSQKPSAWPSVYTLLPAPLRQRPPARGSAVAGVQAVGRLDQDTTGLLLLSDDGAFIHRMASPRQHLEKVYEVSTRDALDDAQIERLLAGVPLDDPPRPTVTVHAVAAERVAPQHLRLVLTEGKYHQVKRMLAAVGNRVEALHRSRIGALALPADLAPGQWRWLAADDLRALGVPG